MAYPNKTINEGSFGSYKCTNTIPIYSRVVFDANVAADQKPQIDVAGVTARGVGIAMQPGVQGSWASIKFLNSPGEQYGLASGSIVSGAAIYTAASGKFSATQGSGVLAGYATCNGYDGGVFTYLPVTAAA